MTSLSGRARTDAPNPKRAMEVMTSLHASWRRLNYVKGFS